MFVTHNANMDILDTNLMPDPCRPGEMKPVSLVCKENIRLFMPVCCSAGFEPVAQDVRYFFFTEKSGIFGEKGGGSESTKRGECSRSIEQY